MRIQQICKHCRHWKKNHVDDQCLFSPTKFEGIDTVEFANVIRGHGFLQSMQHEDIVKLLDRYIITDADDMVLLEDGLVGRPS